MNNLEATYQAIVEKLTDAMVSGQVLDYVKVLQQGNYRQIITEETRPGVIIVHPARVESEWHAMPTQKKDWFVVEIRGVLKVPNPMSPVVRDGDDNPGILTMDGDIKDVLEQDLTIGGTTLRPDLNTTAIRNIGEDTWETVINARIWMNLYRAGQRSV